MATDAPRAPGWKQMRRWRERRTPVFIDESGFYLLPAVVRTYAPCGITPVLRPFVMRAHLSVMSGVTPDGQFYTLTRRRPLRSVECIAFLGHVRRMVGGDLLAVWDGSPFSGGGHPLNYILNLLK